FVETADASLDDLAKAFVTSLTELYRARVGTNYLPKPEEMDELRQVVQDYRLLGEKAMAARFDQATRRFMVTSASDYTAGILLSGEWEPGKDG
ncbi:MAG: MerR family transcriptional regulator, partial [Mycobacterium sp.]|nr:MerR family transcriptional regulator [Mycobacterium sp.]